jgi:NAD-dependent SIR2 family protein deacetylase
MSDRDVADQMFDRVSGQTCSYCGATENIGKIKDEAHPFGLYKCYDCGKQFVAEVENIWNSRLPIRTWLFLHGKPLNADELKNSIDITVSEIRTAIGEVSTAIGEVSTAIGEVSKKIEAQIQDNKKQFYNINLQYGSLTIRLKYAAVGMALCVIGGVFFGILLARLL